MITKKLISLSPLSQFLLKIRFIRIKYTWFITNNSYRILKRILDITVSFIMLIILIPLFIIVSLCIIKIDKGPVLFWQKRVGKWGKPFMLPKFRSMYVGADDKKKSILKKNNHNDSITFKMRNDPRITPVGKLIIKLSIDELPQLWNVLKGEMSLVGPRPATIEEVSQYSLNDRRRLDITPGITCIWQVSGRGDIPFKKQLKLDVNYIETCNFLIDLKILFLTIPAVISGKGAY
ncbi:MAG: sugar transferase [Deltaproteobacteria bacterium]|nr:sugar transferase [Deltaproteobacteria bacterium]